MSSRWDLLLETKPIPLMDHLLDEVARLISADLAKWPLPVTEIDPCSGRAVAQLLESDQPGPSPAVFVESFRLARWELERQFDAYDEYMRNQRWQEKGLSATDKPLLLFVSRWLVEQLLALGESTEGRVNRRLMLDALARIQRRAHHT